MKRNQDNDAYAVMYRPSREPFDTYPTENAARQALKAGDYKTDSDASPESVCLAVWDSVRGWIEHKATTPETPTDLETALRQLWTAQGIPQDRQNAMIADVTAKAQPGAQIGPWTLEALTDDETTAEAERIAAQERRREQREEIARRQAAPIRGRSAGAIAQGVLFATDENLFSGRSAERATA